VGIFDFVKDAGERLFGGEDEGPTEQVRTVDMALADKAKGESLMRLASSMDLGVENLDVKFRDGVATVGGSADSQTDKEKIILLIGNTQGVARVDDRIRVSRPEPEARMYTVVSGDSLSKISKACYGDAMKYMKIFEANQPMLKDPNKIYPGQVLRIPPLD
jgi:nucleoid-associated protein YgaU